ncbi:MAG: iron uptake porin [Aphanothece sp. CMT-3BRIN-NPC111]|jgi:BMFP domain-containing protein YqiC|nr:iron uptake porin [Aphanothece sp. CMT-3BRIN-NPC111]
MSKLFWNTLKVGPTVLWASLIASTTLAAEMVPDRMAGATTDKSTGSLQLIDQSTLPEGKSEEKPETNSASSSLPSASPVLANNTVAEQKLIAQATPDAASAAPTSDTSVLEQVQLYNDGTTSNNNINVEDPMGQITNASQFRDVQPSDWAYEALDRVVQKYGCLVGYPDGTYRGNRALSRYEFAAGLNACLRQIESLIAANGADVVARRDFEALQRLTEEFRTELATLGTRVDNLEGRTSFLEARQFSTTTKLAGEVIFSVSDVFGGTIPGASNNREGDDVPTIFGDRVRLNFDTSFTGKDRLRTRLQARNITPFNNNITGTNMTRLGYDGVSAIPVNPGGNDVEIHRLEYRFPLTSQATVYLATTGTEYNDIVYTFNPLFESAGTGSISRFGRFNPIYRQSREGAGVAVDYKLGETLGLSVGYAVPRDIANDPNLGGLFNGSYAALAQLAFRPSEAFNLGLTYVHSYNEPVAGASATNVSIASGTGSTFAERPFGNVTTSANHYGLEASFRFSPRIVLSGWAGFTDAQAENGSDANAEVWNYAVTLGFPDLGKKGNLLGFVFGMPPKVTDNDIKTREDNDTSYHIEGFYRYRIGSNIDVTPGLFVILNPEHNENNDTLVVGTLRTTFRF